MIFHASDFHVYFQPASCDLRVYLRHKGEPEAKPSPYVEVLKKLGDRHEASHLQTFPEFIDMKAGMDRERRTIEAIKNRAPVIYQARFKATLPVNGITCEVIGEPDFLIATPNGYIIRDSKMARRVTKDDHPEILHQLRIYGWLFEKNLEEPPHRLEAHSGTGEIIEIPYNNGDGTIETLERIISIRLAESEPYSPVGWSKCGGCGYNERCWNQAKENKDVALLVAVDQNLAFALRANGVSTIDELLKSYTDQSLAELKKPWGNKTQKVGKRAGSILRNARAYKSGQEILLKPPDLPAHDNYVMFDLEGMPPQFNELDKIYLWGIQVYGKVPGEFHPAVAGFGPEGDREGWEMFLAEARNVFKKYGDTIPFVHWAPYEKTFLNRYIDRYGDPDGTGQKVIDNLLDLLVVTKDSLALPLPSYSLKVIEPYVGFKRTQDEYGGQWSMAKYIEATEMEDPQERDAVMNEILVYNKEDLASMWAIFEWLMSKKA
ncbi:MAG: hypothetical protein KCHDKBKB_01625 [Elusimicrobia bacterium]|nr:hypothetical protein [Elusimicrobiota bacterium]